MNGIKHYQTREISSLCVLKSNATVPVLKRREVDRSTGLASDQSVEFLGSMPRSIVRLSCVDSSRLSSPGNWKALCVFDEQLNAQCKPIAKIHKSRWQIEFFKWIKQNLKIKALMGKSKDAVMTPKALS